MRAANRVIRYGMTRDLILGLEVVTADGTVLKGVRKYVKNNTGIDLKQPVHRQSEDIAGRGDARGAAELSRRRRSGRWRCARCRRSGQVVPHACRLARAQSRRRTDRVSR